MITVYPKTKVFVHCPAGSITGGAELLHQIVSILRDNLIDAYIVYHGNSPHTLPDDYSDYNIKITERVIDEPQNIEVIYEGRFDLVRNNNKIQKLLWWLSVDHFFICSLPFLSIRDIAKYSNYLAIKTLIKRISKLIIKRDHKYFFNPITLKELRELKSLNGYQSEYAQNFLQNNGFKELMPLKDFININHKFEDVDLFQKKDIVLYNPKKGYNFTKKLIASAPDIKWVPLIGMNRDQLINTIREAKVYIDFGYHPGKDRLPRECAINGCCIITGLRGSAGFFEDVMVTQDYKFKDTASEIPRAIKKIRWIFDNYPKALDDFDIYRKAIMREKSEFENQIAILFGYAK